MKKICMVIALLAMMAVMVCSFAGCGANTEKTEESAADVPKTAEVLSEEDAQNTDVAHAKMLKALVGTKCLEEDEEVLANLQAGGKFYLNTDEKTVVFSEENAIKLLAKWDGCNYGDYVTCTFDENGNFVSSEPAISTDNGESAVENEENADMETITFGTYEQDNNADNGAEPIEWLVMKTDGNKSLLLSKYVLDVRPFDDSADAVTWETASLRDFMNDTFYNTAFSEDEKGKIVKTTVTADANLTYAEAVNGNDTEDFVFALSMKECVDLFQVEKTETALGSVYFAESMVGMVTPYAQANGASKFTDADENATWWWLRTGGNQSNCVSYVGAGGTIDELGTSAKRDVGVRPAIWIEK